MSQFAFGAGQMFGTRTDVTNATPARLGTMQDIQIDFSGEIKELFGQYQLPVDAARGKLKIAGKAKFAEFSATTMNNLFFGQTVSTGGLAVATSEAHSVPAVTPFTVTTTNSATWSADLGVYYANSGLKLQLVASAPTQGQYSVAAGVYTFAAADASAAVLISYTYTVTTGANQIAGQTSLMGVTPKFSAVFTNTYGNNTLTLELFACVGTKLTMPTKVDDYTIEEYDFSAYMNNAYEWGTLTLTDL